MGTRVPLCWAHCEASLNCKECNSLARGRCVGMLCEAGLGLHLWPRCAVRSQVNGEKLCKLSSKSSLITQYDHPFWQKE